MKKIAIFFCIVIVAACGCKKDTITKEKEYNKNPSKLTLNDFKGDTLAYVQTKILDRKEYYIGKKFDVLLNDFNIPIKKIFYIADDNDKTSVSNTIFEIYDGSQIRNKLNKGEIPVNLIVEWKPALKAQELDKLNSERGKRGSWTSENEAYFREQIVGNIGRTNYPDKGKKK